MVHATTNTISFAFATTLALPFMMIVPSDIQSQIRRPASDLLVEEVESGRNRCLLGQFAQLMEQVTIPGGIDFSSLWDEHHISFHVASGFVVFAMGDLPGKVRDQKGRVAEPTNSIVQRLARREGLMATLVCENPQSGPKESLHHGVQCPKASSDRR